MRHDAFHGVLSPLVAIPTDLVDALFETAPLFGGLFSLGPDVLGEEFANLWNRCMPPRRQLGRPELLDSPFDAVNGNEGRVAASALGLASSAGVVVIDDAAPAAIGRVYESARASPAVDVACEVVEVLAIAVGVVAILGKPFLNGVEGRLVDERWMSALMLDLLPNDFSEVEPVGQHFVDSSSCHRPFGHLLGLTVRQTARLE